MKNLLLILLILLGAAQAQGQVIITVAGSGTSGFSGDGHPATNADFNHPIGLIADDHGNIYIQDNDNYRIRKVDSSGIVNTICGFEAGFYGDNIPAIEATIRGPVDFAIDSLGNLFFTDGGNNCVREIDVNGIIHTIAGTGIGGYNGDSILATSALLQQPSGLAFDKHGNLLIVDYSNYRIRKIDAAGIITTIVGNGVRGFSMDGSRGDTSEITPQGNIIVGKHNEYYFEDSLRIRKLDTSGILTTIAGNGVYGFGGDDGPATAASIAGAYIAIDTQNHIYIADQSNYRIRKLNADGTIITIAGTGIGGYNGDFIAPTDALLCSPVEISIDKMNNIYFSDECNTRIREITLDTPLSVKNVSYNERLINLYPNPNNGNFNVRLTSAIYEEIVISLVDVTGKCLQQTKATTNSQINLHTDIVPGIYFVDVQAGRQKYISKMIIE